MQVLLDNMYGSEESESEEETQGEKISSLKTRGPISKFRKHDQSSVTAITPAVVATKDVAKTFRNDALPSYHRSQASVVAIRA